MSEQTYRWNKLDAAAAYDEAAPIIHPQYEAVQSAVLQALPFPPEAGVRLIDLGGGSGRLAERILATFPSATVLVIDQSEPFLQLAQTRLARFNSRATFLQRSLQDDWYAGLQPVDAIVSTSAIHHLESHEKQSLFRLCYDALKPGGRFINGDEHRPQSEEQHRDLLARWGEHMKTALAAGRIPASFAPTIDAWKSRNIEHYGAPKRSGDDCHETVETEASFLRDAGFTDISILWHVDLWAVITATRTESFNRRL